MSKTSLSLAALSGLALLASSQAYAAPRDNMGCEKGGYSAFCDGIGTEASHYHRIIVRPPRPTPVPIPIPRVAADIVVHPEGSSSVAGGGGAGGGGGGGGGGR